MILQNCKPLQRLRRNIQTPSELLIQRLQDSDRLSRALINLDECVTANKWKEI